MAEETAKPDAPVTTPTEPPATPPAEPPVTPSEPTTPPTPPVTPPTPPTPPAEPLKPSLSEEQVASMKADIAKDVSGEVTKEVSKGVIQKIGEALGLTKKEEEKLPTDAVELKKLVGEEVTKRFDRVSEDADKEEKDDASERQTRIDNTIKGWHFQYNQLASLGKVPVIKNNTDANDEGVEARRKLIMAVGNIIDEIRKLDPTSEHIPSISEVLVRFPNVLTGPPGADLPISGNTAVRENEDSFSYEKDIAGKSFEQIVEQAS
jgi:hypothetical protein